MGHEAQTVIGAGLSTTAWALTTATFFILSNSEVLESLRAELLDAVPDFLAPDAFSFQKLETLPFLRGCVKEGIRLSHPVTSRLPRIMDFPLQFNEWIIPTGTPISMNSNDVHLDEKLFPTAQSFRPERWIGNPKAPDGESLEKYFVAFGKGPRMCLGIKYVVSTSIRLCVTLTPNFSLAYMELYVALATFFRRFRAELYETDISDIELKHDFFLPSPRLDSKGVRIKVVGVEH
jgi:cytochrome P450